jgi:hypothetical protein
MDTTKPFAVALRELVVDNDFVTQRGEPNWAAFASELEGVHYETLRRAATGRRPPSPSLIEECARVLRLRPEYFLEYRVYEAQRDFEPAAVGLEQALRNLTLWRGAKSADGASPVSNRVDRRKIRNLRK